MFKPYYKPYIYIIIYIVVYSSVHIPNHPQPVTKPRFHLAMDVLRQQRPLGVRHRPEKATGEHMFF